MRPATVIIAVAALTAASAYQLELADYWPKFGAVQAMSFCLGEKGTISYVKLLLNTTYECDKASREPDSDQTISSLEAANWDKIFNEYSPRLNHENEFVPDNTKLIPYVKRRIARLIKRFRCTMQGTYVTDSNNNIDLENLVEGYKSMGLAPVLLADLLAGVNQCYQLTQCLPKDQPDDSPIPIDVVLVKTFLNCERYMRNWACLKNYVKSYVAAGEFDFSGADGTLDFLPDDEARAAAIALANELVGGGDYGLFE